MLINLVTKNGKSFRIYNNLSYTNSNTEVTFQDLVLDFTDHNLLEIPYKYQECSVVKTEGNVETVLFTGYVSEVSFGDMIMSEEHRELNLTLVSPMAMATVRSATLVGTYTKVNAIKTALQPLLEDGFVINTLDVPDGQITCNFLLETIEYIMNELCYKLGLFWHIDQNKNIIIKQIANMFIEKPTANLSGKIENCLRLQPSVENIEYANVINIKKARMYYFAQSRTNSDGVQKTYVNYQYPLVELPVKVKKGDTITLKNPFVMNTDRLRQLANEHISSYWRRRGKLL